ncbi:MAG: hypothetical protein Q8O74_04810 [bacterium]|nr:hypothetical protein [bacterium]
MKTKVMICLSLILAVIGCSNNRHYNINQPGDINEALSNKKIVVTLDDGRILNGKRAFIKSDTLCYDIASNTFVPIKAVYKITAIDAGKGASRGGICGLLAGGLLGAGIGYLSGDDHDGLINLTAGQKAKAIGAGCGIIAGLLGMGIGYIEGYKTDYYYTDTLNANRPALPNR